MERKRRKKMRTRKQRWAFERTFQNKGRMASVLAILKQIAYSKSTLTEEREAILRAIAILEKINFSDKKTISWLRFAFAEARRERKEIEK